MRIWLMLTSTPLAPKFDPNEVKEMYVSIVPYADVPLLSQD